LAVEYSIPFHSSNEMMWNIPYHFIPQMK